MAIILFLLSAGLYLAKSVLELYVPINYGVSLISTISVCGVGTVYVYLYTHVHCISFFLHFSVLFAAAV